MARIRSIKPEFWTSEQVVMCSPLARLLFVGLWTFADDGGVHPASVRRLKMEVFPADAFDDATVTGLVGELLNAGLVREYDANGERFWFVTGWHRHQRIDRPTFRHPLPPNAAENVSPIRRTLGEDSSTTLDQLALGPARLGLSGPTFLLIGEVASLPAAGHITHLESIPAIAAPKEQTYA